MKNLILLTTLLLFASCKKEEYKANQIKEFSIQSTSNGANYDIKVALPDEYNPTTQKYATIYVLDGEDNFDFVAVKCNEISKKYSTSNVLVVSIGYGNDRSVDYTPSNTNDGDGGSEKYMLFIKNELIPKLESEFGADTLRKSRTFLGHSFGGLCVAYAFTNFNSVFENYIMLSPSIWYDNEIILKLEQQNRNTNRNNHQLVFMALGELENSGRMFAPYQALYQRLHSNYSGIQIKSHLEPHLDHMGSKKPNIIEGLNFYFQNK